MARVSFPQSGLAVDVEPGVTLLDAARRAGLELEAPCNGQGTCGKCRVTVDRPDGVHRRGGEAPGASVLSCEAETTDADLVVTVPAVVRGRDRVLLTGERVERPHRPWVRREVDAAAGVTAILHGEARVAVRPGATRVLGLAVDVGTTTLVASLLDLEDGRELSTVGALNPQTRLGHDVLSRIQVGSEPAGLAELHRLLADELNRMSAEALRRAGAHEDELQEIVLAGNTAMLHLAARLDPRSLGKYPYTPALRGGTRHPASELGLRAAPEATVYLPPVFDGFVGADISAGAIACGLAGLAGATLFIDIGTNGEMVLAVDGRLVATSTAAGPAFEGMNITFGMRAAPGAIEKVAVESAGLRAATIGGTRARGICGSGLVDAVSELVRSGLVDAGGRFARPEQLPTTLAALLVPYRGKNALLLASDADHPEGVVVLTQHDVRQVQLAKGAIRAGIDALLAHARLAPDRVDRVLLAGSFGAHLRTESLVGIGLLPAALRDKVVAVGNTSRTGAEALLLDVAARTELQRAVDSATVIDLAHAPGFEAAFVAALGFPRGAAAARAG
jgi:uncharacterized 2Fe-2S/4Fe-4S cluster protein (DUF4445 family)